MKYALVTGGSRGLGTRHLPQTFTYGNPGFDQSPIKSGCRYNELYPSSELHILENEGHFMTKNKAEICSIITSFLRKELFE
jgi:hypothetical protein